ncbi:MAG: hypothetical protein H6983_05170 [Ectothiorhodospiraceae bacterium]|nr:hypothetical protein [Ectothiorhodospiraceae bacterium]
MRDRIFVQIAAYRDPQLEPTVRHLLANASGDFDLTFGICWQHAEDEPRPSFTGPAFRILDVPHEESRGACWARHRLQALYDGERWTLQLDSHHRFAPGWDRTIVEMLESLEAERPLLTTYLPAFDPADETLAPLPCSLRFDGFSSLGALLVAATPLDDAARGRGPVPARFFSGHFAFAHGRFCQEVPYDPHLYFHGEEISMAVRAFTHGYDLFHPHVSVAWHEYSRRLRPKHWDDHRETASDHRRRRSDWGALDRASQRRMRILLGMEAPGAGESIPPPYGLGTARSLRDYERFAGVHFASRGVHPSTLANDVPPSPVDPDDATWLAGLHVERLVEIHVLAARLDPARDYRHWWVTFHDAGGEELYRIAIARERIDAMRLDDGYIIQLACYSPEPPDHCVIHPYHASGSWDDALRVEVASIETAT